MKVLSESESRSVNAGKTYTCPFCHDVSGSYASVYWHALSSGCFKANRTLKSLWDAGWSLISLGSRLGGLIK